MTFYFISLFLFLNNIIYRCREIKLKSTRQQPKYLQIKELSNSWVPKILQVLNGARSWYCLHHWWLSWWFADWILWLREILIFFDGNWLVHKENVKENVEWLSHIYVSGVSGSSIPHAQPLLLSFAFLQVSSLSWVLASYDVQWNLSASPSPCVEWWSHISRVRFFGVAHSHMLSHFFHHLHFSKLVLCQGYLRHMMFAEISLHHLHLSKSDIASPSKSGASPPPNFGCFFYIDVSNHKNVQFLF